MYLVLLNVFLFSLYSFSFQASDLEDFRPEVMERMNDNDLAIKKISYLSGAIPIADNMALQAQISQDLTERFLFYEEATNGLYNVTSFAGQTCSAEFAAQSLSDCVGQCMLCFSRSKEGRSSLAQKIYERKSLFARQLLRDLRKNNNSVD